MSTKDIYNSETLKYLQLKQKLFLIKTTQQGHHHITLEIVSAKSERIVFLVKQVSIKAIVHGIILEFREKIIILTVNKGCECCDESIQSQLICFGIISLF